MGFRNTYTRTLPRTNGEYLGEKSTILPFFGFHYEKGSKPYQQTVYIYDSNALSGKSPMTRTEYDHTESFYRVVEPSGKEKELEDRFCALLGNKDIFKTKYIPTSFSEYKSEKSHSSGGVGCGFGCLLSVLLTVAWFVLFNVLFPHMERIVEARVPLGNTFESVDEAASVIYILAMPLVFILFSAIVTLIINITSRIIKKIKKAPQKTPEEIEKELKESYFNSMIWGYSSEQAAILREYAILKGYDKL